MAEQRLCRRSGRPIPAGAPRGACPACLIGDTMVADRPGAIAGRLSESDGAIDIGDEPADGRNTLTIL